MKSYRLTTVTYGATCAPFQATRVLYQLAKNEGHNFPLAVKIITSRTYVDDTLSGGDNLEEVIESTIQLKNLLHAGGFNLRKWCANDFRVLRLIPPDLIEAPKQVGLDRSSSV